LPPHLECPALLAQGLSLAPTPKSLVRGYKMLCGQGVGVQKRIFFVYMPFKPIIKISKLNVIYFLGRSNEIRALTDINFDIFSGEFIIFFGPSGCGKSTLLYSIAGLEKNIKGDIIVDEKNLSDFSPDKLEEYHQKKVGMIFQSYYLINSLNVLENIVLPQIALGISKKKRTKRAFELLEYFRVKDQADKLPSELSGGQQQRIAICRALVNDPDILLADEPVGNLDSKSAEDVMELLKELNKKFKKTIILVTHNPAHLNFAHRVFYMKDGKVIEGKTNKAINLEAMSEGGMAIGPSVAKDMELLARTYSSLTSSNIGNLLLPFKAKQIVSEVLVNMTSEELGKIEKRVESLIMVGIYDEKATYEYFDSSLEKGGLGMDSRTAKKLAEKIVGIVKEIKKLEEEENKIKQSETADMGEEIMEVRHYLFKSFNININNFSALETINKAIKDRMLNNIDKDVFQKKINLSVRNGGAGIDERTARKLAKRLELLILGKYK